PRLVRRQTGRLQVHYFYVMMSENIESGCLVWPSSIERNPKLSEKFENYLSFGGIFFFFGIFTGSEALACLSRISSPNDTAGSDSVLEGGSARPGQLRLSGKKLLLFVTFNTLKVITRSRLPDHVEAHFEKIRSLPPTLGRQSMSTAPSKIYTLQLFFGVFNLLLNDKSRLVIFTERIYFQQYKTRPRLDHLVVREAAGSFKSDFHINRPVCHFCNSRKNFDSDYDIEQRAAGSAVKGHAAPLELPNWFPRPLC
ncbi:unnamed protein product, partial [Nesidiocoris tenuis]